MRVFISWSGERSRQVAEALHDWLPSVIQAVQPWMSANDIEKGTRWRSGLANELEQASVSIICLTPENLEAPWINFEAGALSKQQQNTYVCTFLFGLEPIDLREPLAQFQATKSEMEDVRKLIHTINRILADSALPEVKLNETFDVWWPRLEQRLSSLPKPAKNTENKGTDHNSQSDRLEHQRDIREILAEILELVRVQSRTQAADLQVMKSRLPSTLNWSSEDAQLLFDFYEQSRINVSKEKMANDEKFALAILRALKAGKRASERLKENETKPNQEKEEVNENTDS
ncbi:MAG: toll/interleukin-1 receptor domain-containing protein [Pyrinomonadaceae bacterium]